MLTADALSPPMDPVWTVLAVIGSLVSMAGTAVSTCLAIYTAVRLSRSNGGGKGDVSRQEFDKLDEYAHEEIHELRDALHKLTVELGIVCERLKAMPELAESQQELGRLFARLLIRLDREKRTERHGNEPEAGVADE